MRQSHQLQQPELELQVGQVLLLQAPQELKVEHPMTEQLLAKTALLVLEKMAQSVQKRAQELQESLQVPDSSSSPP